VKNSILIGLLIVLSTLTHAQTWTKVTIGDYLTADFPDTVEVGRQDDLSIYASGYDGYSMIVTVKDRSAAPDFNVKPGEVGKFYDDFLSGVLNSTDSVLRHEKIYIGAYEGREIRYIWSFNGSDMQISSRVILIDEVVIKFEVWDMSDAGHDEIVTRFFESIRLK
jgi:hypothetical protein